MNPSSLADRQALLLSLILIVLLILLCGGMSAFVLSDRTLNQAYIMARAAQTIETKHFAGLSSEQLVHGARTEMLGLLDRYSGYVAAEDFDRLREELTGAYAGLGISIITHDLGLLIMSVRSDGPAGKAGLEAGDIILAADSVEVAGLGARESTRLLRGDDGTSVLVRVLNVLSGDTVETAIIRAEIPLIHVSYAGFTPDSAIYIRLTDFDAGASEQVAAALDSLLEKYASPPTGLILDLRGNPGGLFREAWETACLFLPEGTFVVGTDARSRWNNREVYASGDDMTDNLPMVLLVDRGSASSSEILAGALQQAGRATLVGDTTFGKGLVQGFVTFPEGDGLRLTISRFYFDNDVYINEFDTALIEVGHGLPPDRYLSLPGRNDFVRAIEYSLLLHQFARLNRQDIIASRNDARADTALLDSLDEFLVREGFAFASARTEDLIALCNTARSDGWTATTEAVMSEALESSIAGDRALLRHHAAHLIMRLQQIAWEQTYGTYRAYHDITVRERPDILYAESLLRKSLSNHRLKPNKAGKD